MSIHNKSVSLIGLRFKAAPMTASGCLLIWRHWRISLFTRAFEMGHRFIIRSERLMPSLQTLGARLR